MTNTLGEGGGGALHSVEPTRNSAVISYLYLCLLSSNAGQASCACAVTPPSFITGTPERGGDNNNNNKPHLHFLRSDRARRPPSLRAPEPADAALAPAFPAPGTAAPA